VFLSFSYSKSATTKFIENECAMSATTTFIEIICFASFAIFHLDLIQIYLQSKYSKKL